MYEDRMDLISAQTRGSNDCISFDGDKYHALLRGS
jgi:hypothetical protein